MHVSPAEVISVKVFTFFPGRCTHLILELRFGNLCLPNYGAEQMQDLGPDPAALHPYTSAGNLICAPILKRE